MGEEESPSFGGKPAGQIAERSCEREAVPLLPELVIEPLVRAFEGQFGRGVRPLSGEHLTELRPRHKRVAQEGREAFRPPDRIEPCRALIVRNHRYGATARKRPWTKLPMPSARCSWE